MNDFVKTKLGGDGEIALPIGEGLGVMIAYEEHCMSLIMHKEHWEEMKRLLEIGDLANIKVANLFRQVIPHVEENI
jgi:hypothetical protein